MGKKSEQYQQPSLTLKIKYKNDHDIYWGNINILAWNMHNKGNNKITELRTILQRESQNS